MDREEAFRARARALARRASTFGRRSGLRKGRLVARLPCFVLSVCGFPASGGLLVVVPSDAALPSEVISSPPSRPASGPAASTMEGAPGLLLPRRRRLGASALSAFADAGSDGGCTACEDEAGGIADWERGGGGSAAALEPPDVSSGATRDACHPDSGLPSRSVRRRLASLHADPSPASLLDMGERAAVEGDAPRARSLLLRAADECLPGRTSAECAQLADALRMLAQLSDADEDVYGSLYFARGAVRASRRAVDLLEQRASGRGAGEAEGNGGRIARMGGVGEAEEGADVHGGQEVAGAADVVGARSASGASLGVGTTLGLASSWRQAGRAFRNAGLPREAARAFTAARESLEARGGAKTERADLGGTANSAPSGDVIAAPSIDGSGADRSDACFPDGMSSFPRMSSPDPEVRALLAEIDDELRECCTLARLEVGRRVGLEGLVLVPPEEKSPVGAEEAARLASDDDAEDAWEKTSGRQRKRAERVAAPVRRDASAAPEQPATHGAPLPSGASIASSNVANFASPLRPGAVLSISPSCGGCSASSSRSGVSSRAGVIRSLRGREDALGVGDSAGNSSSHAWRAPQARATPDAFKRAAEPAAETARDDVREDDVEVFAAVCARDSFDWLKQAARNERESPRVLEVTRHRGLCGLVLAAQGGAVDVLPWSDASAVRGEGEAFEEPRQRSAGAGEDPHVGNAKVEEDPHPPNALAEDDPRSASERAVAHNAQFVSGNGGTIRVLSTEEATATLLPSEPAPRGGAEDAQRLRRLSEDAQGSKRLSEPAYDAVIFVDIVRNSADASAVAFAIGRFLAPGGRGAALLAHRHRSSAVDGALLAAARSQGLSLRALAREQPTRSTVYSIERTNERQERTQPPQDAQERERN